MTQFRCGPLCLQLLRTLHRVIGAIQASLLQNRRVVHEASALYSLGRSGLADLIERTCQYAQRFADGLHAGGHQILNEVVINQALVSFGDEVMMHRIIEALQNDGACWCGPTTWQGHSAMRISVSSWATTEADVDRSLAVMLRIADEQAYA